MTVLESLPENARVCVIRLRSLGDCVLTTPALTLLKDARPDLEIGVVVEQRFNALFEKHPAVQKIVAPDWRSVRRWGATLCVNLHGGNRSQWLTLSSGAKWRAGFAHHNLTFPYNLKIGRPQQIMSVRRTVHTAEHLASVFFALGVPLQEVPRAHLFAPKPDQKGRYAILHPYASAPGKQWPAERFCELARYLDLWNVKPIFLAGAHDDTAPYRAHAVFQGSLSAAMSLISGAVVFVGNDSGPAHIAAAFGIPAVVLFGSSKPVIWGPWRTESEMLVDPCGLEHVSVSRVIAALERLRALEEAHA
jgi:heptosyltransferase III